MMKRVSRLVFGVALACVLACGRSAGGAGGNDPYAKLLAHTGNMIKILKDNKGDPAKATKELTAYQETNKAELHRLKQELADFMQKDPMKAAPVSAIYGLRSAELATLTAELAAKLRAQ